MRHTNMHLVMPNFAGNYKLDFQASMLYILFLYFFSLCESNVGCICSELANKSSHTVYVETHLWGHHFNHHARGTFQESNLWGSFGA